MLWFGHQQSEEIGEGERAAGGCYLYNQKLSDLWHDIKVLPLMIEFIVILNHLGVAHLWWSQK